MVDRLRMAYGDTVAVDGLDLTVERGTITAVLGPSETVPVEDGKLLLGTWQTILLVELDGPRAERSVAVQVIGV